MNKIMNLLSIPFARFGIGLLGTIGFGLLGSVFPPVAVLAFICVFLTLMLGELEHTLWFESDAKEHCPVCGEETGIQLIRIQHRMYAFVPLPLILQLCQLLSIPYRCTYYKVCAKCRQTHLEENDFASLQAIAKGGLATVTEITKAEFEAMVKKD